VAELEETPEFDLELQAQDLEWQADEGEGGEMVSVEVCVLTGLRASSDCPTAEIREFAGKMEPRVSCSSGFHRN
jgi:hypothetical protein